MWIGQCRPLSISDSVPSTTQAGQSESEPPPASPQQIWLGIWWVSPSSVPLSQADCFVSASVSRTKTFGRCRTPPRLLVPTPTLTDELDPGLSLPLFGAVSCLLWILMACGVESTVPACSRPD